jgi:hypothetical protein
MSQATAKTRLVKTSIELIRGDANGVLAHLCGVAIPGELSRGPDETYHTATAVAAACCSSAW